jgi:carboxypeptidase Q
MMQLPLRPAAVAAYLVICPTLSFAEPVDYEMVTKIRHEGLQRSQVMDTLRGLTDGFGARLTGSPALRDASAWSDARFREWGLAQVRQEPFEFGEGWSFSAADVRGISPFTGPMRALPQAWTVGTEGAVRGEAVKVKLAAEGDFEALRGKLRGKIVFIEPNPADVRGGPPAAVLQDPTQERPFQRHDDKTLEEIASYRIATEPDPNFADRFRMRWQFVDARNRFLEEEGALATVERSTRLSGILWVTGGGGGGWPGRARGVPGLVMSFEHFNRVARTLDAGQPVELEIDVAARFHDDAGPPGNVLAEIPGTDRAGEIVMAGAHIDSWHGGTGTTDNAAGVAVVMEAARILSALGVKPRRTIRFALWAGEEQGLIGSRAYVRNHIATRPAPEDEQARAMPSHLWPPTWPIAPKPGHEKYSVYFNLDNGSGRIRGIYAQDNAGVVPIFRPGSSRSRISARTR